MAYNVRVLRDSVTVRGDRLTTMEFSFPRLALADFNTHRVLSRNGSSSRAMPVWKKIKAVFDEPFVPETFGKNRPGMQSTENLSEAENDAAELVWRVACQNAIESAQMLESLGVHKQWANRVLEPFAWHVGIVSSTEWDNLFGLRDHRDAQPEIKKLVSMLKHARNDSTPIILNDGEWHLPLLHDIDELIAAGLTLDQLKLVSVGRCARVSYLTHDGVRDPMADIKLAMQLQGDGHLSPFEHVAQPGVGSKFEANFRGWRSMRRDIRHEDNFLLMTSGREER